MLGADPVSYAVVFSAGFVSFASPCVLPLVPAYLGFVSGVGIGDGKSSRWGVVVPTAIFVLGFSLMFAALGAGAGVFGDFLIEERRNIEIIGGVFIIVMGLLLLGKGVPGFLMQERRLHVAAKPATFVGAFLAGIAFAVGWTPCIGPTLAAALTIAAGTGGGAATGASLLFVYSLGLGLPFLLAGLFLHSGTALMGGMKRHLNLISQVGAAILVFFGVLLATGQLTQVTAQLSQYSPAL
ncbi:MAG: cytochrome c biogenesis protein CcdA [Thermoleophilia bacterium]|nr:cytochrome c biogenesis protein CcdA [Thermoleophilia bacterium]